VTLEPPLKEGEVHVTSPVIPIVRAVVSVAALPEMLILQVPVAPPPEELGKALAQFVPPSETGLVFVLVVRAEYITPLLPVV
jgi:hypothetical protein